MRIIGNKIHAMAALAITAAGVAVIFAGGQGVHAGPSSSAVVPPAKPAMARVNRVPVPAPRPAGFNNTGDESTRDGAARMMTGMVKVAGEDVPLPGHKPFASGKGPLSERDAALYKEIFAYQTRGHWDRADDAISRLRDLRLRGHVLYQRYMHPTAYISGFEELKNWLELYADHPGAVKIYRLALKRKPAGFKGHIPVPVRSAPFRGALEQTSLRGKLYEPRVKRSRTQTREVRRLHRYIMNDIQRGGPTRALGRLTDSNGAMKWMDRVERDLLRAQIAKSYMHAGRLDKALQLARESADRSGTHVPMAGWVAGLVSWRKGAFEQAARYFELTARSDYANGWASSAGAYWASRSHMRAGHYRQVEPWLRRAAAQPRTFYGLIALRALGQDYDFNWDLPAFTQAHEQRLREVEAGKRAMALAKAGQFRRATRELRRLHPGQDEDLQQALIAFATHAGLPSYSMKFANAYMGRGDKFYDAALYPLPPWEPKGGYDVDRALIYAMIRQESRFDPEAENASGATGLMQLMPSTASYVAGRRDFRTRQGRHLLKDPSVNMGVGQSYIKKLLHHPQVQGDLLALTIAYNAGPGNLARWRRQLADIDDPLLFVESIPVAETRAYVERIMRNFWIYRARLRQNSPSLTQVASGLWATYKNLDSAGAIQLAGTEPASK